jgi:hypothetical protein
MDRWDWLFLIGLLIGLAGLWMIYPPLMLLVAGVALCLIGYLAAESRRLNRREG